MNGAHREELIPTRESLLERLRRWDDHQAWQQFFDTYWKLMYRAAIAAGLSSIQAEEVIQDVVLSVAKQMPEFRYVPAVGGGSFKKWLLNLTRWRITDVLRRKRREHVVINLLSDGSEIPVLADPAGNGLEKLWDAEWDNTLLEAACERLKHQVDPKHYQLFDLIVIKGWSGVRVARELKVSISQAYTVKHRLTKQLKTILEYLQENGW